jgi:hypothetical protein
MQEKKNNSLTQFLNANAINVACYFHVQALLLNGIAITVDKAIRNFIEKHAAFADENEIESLKRSYYRLLEKERDINKKNS